MLTVEQNAKLQSLDQALHAMVQGIDILDSVAPINYQEERVRFFASNATENPNFLYKENQFNVFAKKRELYQLPVETLGDDDLTRLYSEVIESYADKLDQFRSVGSEQFMYDSLRYYGEPSDKDIRNAQFVLHVPDSLSKSSGNLLNADAIVAQMHEFAQAHGYRYELVVDGSMIANALVSGTKVKINAAASLGEKEVAALAHHELGVHLVTTLNAQTQPLKVLSLGSPVNTTSQEGIAILCEFLSGNLTVSRLKILALRVLAVKSMLDERDFKRTYQMLLEQYNVSEQLAFTITARVYRGGGFTKDYLYLKGFHQILHAYETRDDFINLLSGKVSLEQLDVVTSLINKSILKAPSYISPAIEKPQKLGEIERFLSLSIK